MIAIDTNVLRRYLLGAIDRCTPIVAEALNAREVLLPPIVLTEALSDAQITSSDIEMTLSIPSVPLFDGYWYRAGNLRRDLISKKLRAPTADCLIAQACIDYELPLLTFDGGFTRYVQLGLKLL